MIGPSRKRIKRPSFRTVWATLQEVAEVQKTMQAEADRRMAEITEAQKTMQAEAQRRSEALDQQMAETDRKIKELAEEHERTELVVAAMLKRADKMDERMDKTIARIDKMAENLGGLNRSMGELIETLIAARLWEKFSAYGYNLQRAYQRIPIFNETNRILTDIDILLVDTQWVMAVEVKREAALKDVEHHLKRMSLIQKYPPAEVAGKKLLGALAGGVVDPDVREYAYASGFFALELTGEAVALAEPPTGFQPCQW